jgi:acyl-CoA reductase-like NAD-dependent aldehyde dehydrogenase
MIALAAALVGVTGTLLAPILSQRLLARVQSEHFERQQQVAHAQWTREQELAELAQRRACYVTTNAAYRRFRIQLMDYLWLLHRGAVDAEARAELTAARDAHNAAFAEAQLVASAAVLTRLDDAATALHDAYVKIINLERGVPLTDGSFEDIDRDLREFWDRWNEMRRVMRADVGVGAPSTDPTQVSL